VDGASFYLGKDGSPESQAEYRRILTMLSAQPAAAKLSRVTAPLPTDLSVNEMLLAFMQGAAKHYRTPDGQPTTEIGELKWSIKPLKENYGHTISRASIPRQSHHALWMSPRRCSTTRSLSTW
jgi:hypothetical protein